MPRTLRQLPLAVVLAALASLAGARTVAGAPSQEAGAAAEKQCGRIVNPYEGTSYEGSDLRRIRAEGVSCRRARQVARGAHHKALGITPPPAGSGTSRGMAGG